ncbi:hypothetical protein FAZ15_13460 [Sphingobacterium olei]|uniref:Uncharacterized protein n=1 Tax=Sphingobacterium olei TaxID=2571155 RepID=A0A4U0NYF8_9SPHI|nr:hypothetical protein [Sphingobacterium olei]TJZ59896.1 hypothetical protein FAZ15_13460 [Sphingobacterium olei]
MCESSVVVHKYNSADYPLIADALRCELSDITPPDDWQVSDSHEKVDKVVVSLSDPAFVLQVLEGIKASPKADVLEDLDKLYRHLSTKDTNEKAVIKTVWEEFRKYHYICVIGIKSVSYENEKRKFKGEGYGAVHCCVATIQRESH